MTNEKMREIWNAHKIKDACVVPCIAKHLFSAAEMKDIKETAEDISTVLDCLELKRDGVADYILFVFGEKLKKAHGALVKKVNETSVFDEVLYTIKDKKFILGFLLTAVEKTLLLISETSTPKEVTPLVLGGECQGAPQPARLGKGEVCNV